MATTLELEFRRIGNRRDTLNALRDARDAFRAGDETAFLEAAARLAELQAARLMESEDLMKAAKA